MSDLGGFSLHELFKGEAEMHAAALSDGLVRLEGTSDPATVEPLMRAAHSIKGAARVIGLDIAVRLAHAMEDSLVAMQKGREAIVAGRIDQLLKGTDLLAALAGVEEADVPTWSAENDAAVGSIVEALRAAPPERVATPSSTPSSTPSLATAAAPSVPVDLAALAAEVEEVAPEKEAPVEAVASPTTVPVAHTAAVPPVTTASPATPATPSSRASAVRVSAEKLDRLLQLAGETMLESRRLSAVRTEATEIKQELARLEDELDLLRTELRRAGRDPAAIAPARGILERSRGRVLSHLLTVEGAIRRGEETSTQLYHEVLSSRMRPFADATGALPRTVRDLARALGKDARLEVVG